jgi:protein subunit release factor B
VDIPEDRLDISFVRSSGSGGQSVNKLSTKVELRMHVQDATWIPGASTAGIKSQGGLGQVGTNATASLASPKNSQATQWPFQSGESAKEGIQEATK